MDHGTFMSRRLKELNTQLKVLKMELKMDDNIDSERKDAQQESEIVEERPVHQPRWYSIPRIEDGLDPHTPENYAARQSFYQEVIEMLWLTMEGFVVCKLKEDLRATFPDAEDEEELHTAAIDEEVLQTPVVDKDKHKHKISQLGWSHISKGSEEVARSMTHIQRGQYISRLEALRTWFDFRLSLTPSMERSQALLLFNQRTTFSCDEVLDRFIAKSEMYSLLQRVRGNLNQTMRESNQRWNEWLVVYCDNHLAQLQRKINQDVQGPTGLSDFFPLPTLRNRSSVCYAAQASPEIWNEMERLKIFITDLAEELANLDKWIDRFHRKLFDL